MSATGKDQVVKCHLFWRERCFFSIVIKGSKLNWDSDANTQYDTSLMQVGRDEVKARMKELESELARAEQTSQLREEVFTSVLNPCYQFFPQIFKPFFIGAKSRLATLMLNYWGQYFVSPILLEQTNNHVHCSIFIQKITSFALLKTFTSVGLKSAEVSTRRGEQIKNDMHCI